MIHALFSEKLTKMSKNICNIDIVVVVVVVVVVVNAK